MLNRKFIHFSTNASLGLVLLLVSGSGCGKPGSNPIESLVSHVALNTFEMQSDQWIQATISLSTGGFSLAGINVPVIDPRDPNTIYGHLTILPAICGGSPGCINTGDVQVSLNLSAIGHVQGVSPFLPNGTPIPVGGLSNSTIIALPIGSGSTQSKLYFAFGPGVAMLGAAISFQAMDPAGKYLPYVDIFQPLHFSGVDLIAGIYTGAVTKTTGIGVFIDLSQVMNKIPDGGAIANALTGNEKILKSKIVFKPVSPSKSQENNVYRKLYELSNQKTVLELK